MQTITFIFGSIRCTTSLKDQGRPYRQRNKIYLQYRRSFASLIKVVILILEVYSKFQFQSVEHQNLCKSFR